MLIKKQDILTLPLHEIAHLELEEVVEWCKATKIALLSTWTLPQMVAHFGSWTLAKTPEGQWDVVATLQQNITSDWHRGLWKLTRVKRALLMPKQIAQADYGAFTPLILSGFKKMQGVGYETWRGCSRLGLILEPELHAAVVHDDYSWCDLGSERLLQLRAQGLITQGGKTEGKTKPSESTWALAGLQDTELGGLPKWTQTILCQCWLAHPKHRSQYMILDPSNWDRMPPPLISAEIFQNPPDKMRVAKPHDTSADLPF